MPTPLLSTHQLCSRERLGGLDIHSRCDCAFRHCLSQVKHNLLLVASQGTSVLSVCAAFRIILVSQLT